MSRSIFPVALLAVTVFAMSSITGRATDDKDDAIDTIQAVKSVLQSQVKAWNSGDVSGFMDGYVNSDELRFASGGSITTGWQPTLDRYLSRYTDREIMGTLEFKDLQVLPLSDKYAEVFGSWHLARKKEVGDASGLFTLLMKKTGKGWRVFHDHTSSAAKELSPAVHQ